MCPVPFELNKKLRKNLIYEHFGEKCYIPYRKSFKKLNEKSKQERGCKGEHRGAGRVSGQGGLTFV